MVNSLALRASADVSGGSQAKSLATLTHSLLDIYSLGPETNHVSHLKAWAANHLPFTSRDGVISERSK